MAFKLYPAGATTNSDSGVTSIEKCLPTLRAMAEVGGGWGCCAVRDRGSAHCIRMHSRQAAPAGARRAWSAPFVSRRLPAVAARASIEGPQQPRRRLPALPPARPERAAHAAQAGLPAAWGAGQAWPHRPKLDLHPCIPSFCPARSAAMRSTFFVLPCCV